MLILLNVLFKIYYLYTYVLAIVIIIYYNLNLLSYYFYKFINFIYNIKGKIFINLLVYIMIFYKV